MVLYFFHVSIHICIFAVDYVGHGVMILFSSIVFLLIFRFIFLLFSVDNVGHGVMGEPGEGREASLPRFTIIVILITIIIHLHHSSSS